MIDKQYPKTVKDFNKWLCKNYDELQLISDSTWCSVYSLFEVLPEQMQAGVYLSYFDECKIVIDTEYEQPSMDEWLFAPSVTVHAIKDRILLDKFKDRMKALKSAIQKASEIREKQL